MVNINKILNKLGPSIGLSFQNWMKLFLNEGIKNFKYYFPRIFSINLIKPFFTPFEIYESLRYRNILKKMNISKPPIFIIGHWRTGTTHIQNLLCKDPQFGYINMLQATFPKSFLSNRLCYAVLKRYLPATRPMDNMELGVNSPTEEEMALGNLIPYSFYNGWYLPKRMNEHYDHFIRFKGLSEKIVNLWKNKYLYLLKKLTYYTRGKQLILKSPANTSRIKILLELFPKAKFIHIYRNPYTVFLSTKNFYKKAIQIFMLQKLSDDEIEYFIFDIYKKMMKDFFKNKRLIPKKNFIETRFEDLEEDPITELNSIYTQLNINGFGTIKPLLLKYLKSIHGYKKNNYIFTKEIIKKVEHNWNFTIDKWDYQIPRGTSNPNIEKYN